MQVFKFGGASVRNAGAVENLAKIVASESDQTVIVVSAMGKTTNTLEHILSLAYQKSDYQSALTELFDYHNDICHHLFNDIPESVTNLYDTLILKLEEVGRYSYDYSYDQVVSIGELLSTTIVAQYLQQLNMNAIWSDARKVIQTDSHWRIANVNWAFTKTLIHRFILPLFNEFQFIVTQGFIGSDNDGHTTTLGREGSDFSGAIFAHCLDARQLTVWKDVEGILNKDPKFFNDAQQFPRLSYREVIEMSYYGASVIHAKTIKPIADKHIPLIVRSFIQPNQPGTQIGIDNSEQAVSSIILKNNQALITFTNTDLSFTSENSIGKILGMLDQENIRTSLVQSSATSFSVCTDFYEEKLEYILANLSNDFEIHYNLNLTLVTIKNYQPEDLKIKLFEDKDVLLEQRSRKNVRFLLKSEKLNL